MAASATIILEFKTTYIDMDAERIVTEKQLETFGSIQCPRAGASFRWFALKLFVHDIVAAGTWEFSEAQVQEVYLVLTSKPEEEEMK